MLYWRSVTPWGWQRHIETCRSYNKLCVKNTFLTLVHLSFFLYKIHIYAQTWIILRKDKILLFQNSLWACSSFSQLLDGAYSYVLQFPGHMYMVHYSNTWVSELYIAYIRDLVPKCGTNLPKPNCVHQVIVFTRNVHLTSQAQHIMHPTITQRVIFQGSHPTSQWRHIRLHHKIMQTTSALITWPGWFQNININSNISTHLWF